MEGTETHGSLTATINVDYTTANEMHEHVSHRGHLAITVWYPRLPLTVQLNDNKLERVHGKFNNRLNDQSINQIGPTRRQAHYLDHHRTVQ